MAMPSDFDRVEIAREWLGLSRQQLAAAVGVSTTALATWTSGIPSSRRAKLAQVLKVSADWILNGSDPPPWYVTMVLASGRGYVDWATLASTQVLTAWWEVIEGALLNRLQKPQCRLIFPSHVRVQRWRFTLTRRVANPDPGSVDESLFGQLDSRELEALACELRVWPKNADLVAIIRSDLPKVPCRLARDSSDDVRLWQDVVRQLVDGARRYRKARSDRQRQIECQSGVWKLLTERQGDEPLLAGRAIVPVLGACLRAARTTEILAVMRSDLEVAVHMALVSDFCDSDFTISDMCRYLKRHRGLHASVAKNSTRRALSDDTISTDTVLRLLKKIATAGKLPLVLCPVRSSSGDARTWRMGVPVHDPNDVMKIGDEPPGSVIS